MTSVLIYGVRAQAQQLRYLIESEGCGQVAAFVVDADYQRERIPNKKTLDGLPILNFEEACRDYPPERYEMAVSLTYGGMMHHRSRVCRQCKAAGYTLFTYVSQRACVYAQSIGEGTIIYPNCSVGYGVVLGTGNFLELGVTIAHHTVVGDYNFFGPAAVVCGGCSIGTHNFFGSNSTTINHAVIGNEVLIGAGAVVRDTRDERVYLPGRTTQWRGLSREMELE